MTVEVNATDYQNMVNALIKLGDLNSLTEAIYEALCEYERSLNGDLEPAIHPSILKQIVAGDAASKFIGGALSGDSVIIGKHRSNMSKPNERSES